MTADAATDPATEPEVLSTPEVAEFWDLRHQRASEMRSGGDQSHDDPTNKLFYALRLGRLIDAMGDQTAVEAPLEVLDAGCGNGWFARQVAAFGHRVVGIDGSPTAVENARKVGGGPRYEVATLSGWRGDRLFDVVYCIDVLFHIMQDDEWEASVRNLAAHVRLGGLLILVDRADDHRRVWGAYQVTRPRGAYLELAEQLGLCDGGFLPYRFRDNGAGIHILSRCC